MNLSIKVSGIEKAMLMFDPKKVERAAKATLNRVAKAGKTTSSDLIRNQLGINMRKGDLDRKIEVKPVGAGLKASIEVSSKEGILLSYFNAKQGSISIVRNKAGQGAGQFGIAQRLHGRRNTGGPVTVTIKKGKSTTLDKRTFIARGRGGVAMVFFRQRSGKLLGRKVYRESSMFGKKIVIRTVKARIIQQWNKEWANQIKQLQVGQGWTDRLSA